MAEEAFVEPISSIDLRLDAYEWAFTSERRTEIELHWKSLRETRPGLWNGDVVLARDVRTDAGRLTGRCFATDFASFVAWSDWKWPDTDVVDCWGAALILSRDGALIYGRMAASTLNAGQVYPPSGGVDMQDVAGDGRIDIEGSLLRELAEETGLNAQEARYGPLWSARAGCQLCLARELRFDENAATLARRIENFNAQLDEPELAGVIVLRSAADITSDIPPYAAGMARHLLR